MPRPAPNWPRTKGPPEGRNAVTPEEKARRKIDRRLQQCGWRVQDYRSMDLSAGPGVAVREFPLTTGFADYLLYVCFAPEGR